MGYSNKNFYPNMSDIDTVIAKVDEDNSGALDKEETKQFVKDTLKEMADGDDNDEFNEELQQVLRGIRQGWIRHHREGRDGPLHQEGCRSLSNSRTNQVRHRQEPRIQAVRVKPNITVL